MSIFSVVPAPAAAIGRACVALCGALALTLAVATGAQAADQTNCYQIVGAGQYCPGYQGGTARVYSNERTSWSDHIDYSCGQPLWQGMVRASNPGGATKYSASGTCYVTDSFPNNTESLRGFMVNASSASWTFVNKSAY